MLIIYVPRVESAHSMVTLHSTIHNGSITLFSDTLLCDLLIDPVWKSPMFGVDLTKFNSATGVVQNGLLEWSAEFGIVEEDIWVVVPSVEMSFDGFNRLKNPIQLLVSCQNNESCFGSWLWSIWSLAAYLEDFVVFFTNFPATNVLADVSLYH